METPEQTRRRRIFWAAAVVVLALCYPLYLYAIRWRADQLAREAAGMLEKHQEQMALATAYSALGLRPHLFPALRTVAVVLSEQRRTEALPIWREILASPKSTLTDVESALDASVGMRAFDLAEEFMANGMKRFGEAPSLERRGAALYETTGDSPRSIQMAQRFLKDHPTDDLVNLIVQRQMLAMGAPSDRVAAKDQMLAIATRSPQLRLDALKWIAKLDGLPKPDLARALQLADQVGDPSIDRLLIRSDLALKLEPGKLPEVARTVFEQGPGLATTSPQLAELGRWFNDKGQTNAIWFDRTLILVSLARAMTDQDLFLIRMDALAGRRQWTEIDNLLSRDNLPLKPVLASLFRIRAKREIGGAGPTDDMWKDLERNLLREPEASFYVGQYLEKLGERARLEKLYQAVVQVAPHTLAANAGLIHLAEQRGNLSELMAVLKEACDRDPSNNLYKNDYSYLCLLTSQNTEPAAREAGTLVAAHPENIGFRITFALAKLSQGDTNGAFTLFEGKPLNWAQLTPGQQAVVAAVEGGHGSAKRAEELARSIDLTRLKQQEFDLLKRWLAAKPSAP